MMLNIIYTEYQKIVLDIIVATNDDNNQCFLEFIDIKKRIY